MAVAMRSEHELARIAAEFDYTDQAHLTRDFRSMTGLTPGAYRRGLQQLMGAAPTERG
ncbi:helix-turn-helix domain-containing protein [Agromyces bauzanensis]